MSYRRGFPSSSSARLQGLEQRRLLSATPWGDVPKLIGQDQTATQFPQVTGAGTAIAVIDTGIDYTHPFLGGGFGPGYKVVGGHDFVDDDNDPMDTFGHGTEVAGVLAASPFDFDGHHYQGVAPQAKLLALRVDASNDPVPDSRIEAALKWVLDNQAFYNIVAVNISFGSGHFSGTHTSSYSDELATLKNRGVFVAAASGNGGVSDPQGVEYPAADPSVFAVGSVDPFDTISEFTERGPNLDILAPGDDVPTVSTGPEDFDTQSGTSFAVPFVCGTVALMKQANPNLKAGDEYSIFHAASVDNVDGDAEFGAVTNLTFQRLDVFNSVTLAMARRPGGQPAGEIATAGYGNSLAYDPDGVLHIVYYDLLAHTLKYEVQNTDGTISAPVSIDASGDDIGDPSIAVDSDGQPSISYFDGTSGDLRFAQLDANSQWEVETIDARGSVGLYSSLAYDNDGHPLISYFRKTSGDLRVARFDGTQWNIEAVDLIDNVGRSTDVAVDKNTGEIAVAYEDSTHGFLKIARRPAGEGQTWTTSVVDDLTTGITFTSLAFDAHDNPAISYYDITRGDLRFAHFDGTNWQATKLASKGAVGLYTQLYFGDDGLANIIYYNRRNNLVAQITGDIGGTWSAVLLQSDGGRYITAATNPTDGSVAYSWFQPGVAKLRVASV